MPCVSKGPVTLFSLISLGLLSIVLQNLTLQKWPFTSSNTTVQESFVCAHPSYTSRIVSYDPLIIHLENFITPAEREYLINRGRPLLQRSLVANRDGGPPIERPARTSSTAFIPYNDTTAYCIQQRAAEFQGFLSVRKIEMLQVVQYKQHQEYRAHYDWGVASAHKRERESTIYGILKGDCEHCGTQFPEISVDWSGEDERWCDFVECEETEMLTFKAVAGSAVFWKNLHDDEEGDRRTLHAGLPVRNGTKVGLNIWTVV
ncbi:hypothetical protein BDV96DRAFT_635016 [Lophiotrema nucula]|uniref:Fe2OG dioxygenase domain-containing protein n=1 Tax=Lophiotrema nucula TaxID=690887 RepID=A0A6A5YVZ9_9PLEO|nr:hypothetical protein BDV96DRAFT_635016 [Lophiotrema nucula]